MEESKDTAIALGFILGVLTFYLTNYNIILAAVVLLVVTFLAFLYKKYVE